MDSIDKEMANGHINAAGDRHGMPDIAAGNHVMRSVIPELPELASSSNWIHEKFASNQFELDRYRPQEGANSKMY